MTYTYRIELFARARELAGAPFVEVSLPPSVTAGQLRQALAETYPALAPLLARSTLAVDQEFADNARVVPPGAAVAVLPPVSGG